MNLHSMEDSEDLSVFLIKSCQINVKYSFEASSCNTATYSYNFLGNPHGLKTHPLSNRQL